MFRILTSCAVVRSADAPPCSDPPASAATGRCPWGSTGEAGDWCSRSSPVARVGIAEVDLDVGGERKAFRSRVLVATPWPSNAALYCAPFRCALLMDAHKIGEHRLAEAWRYRLEPRPALTRWDNRLEASGASYNTGHSRVESF